MIIYFGQKIQILSKLSLFLQIINFKPTCIYIQDQYHLRLEYKNSFGCATQAAIYLLLVTPGNNNCLLKCQTLQLKAELH